jgi:hypothetical protein
MGYKMKGMDFGTGQTHGANNSPVKFLGALLGAAKGIGGKLLGAAAKKGAGAVAKGVASGAAKKAATSTLAGGLKGVIGRAAKKFVGEGAKEMGKGLVKQAVKKGAGQLAKGAVKKAATDSWAQHQQAKQEVPSNRPTVNW